MRVPLNFMGFDFVAVVDYDVTSYGAPASWSSYGGDPEEPPEWEVDSIELFRDDVPLTAEEHRRCIVKTPLFEATGALFDCLANDDKINDAICEAISSDGPPEPDWI